MRNLAKEEGGMPKGMEALIGPYGIGIFRQFRLPTSLVLLLLYMDLSSAK